MAASAPPLPVQPLDPALLVPVFPRTLKKGVLDAMTASVAAQGVLVPLQAGRRRADGRHPLLDGATRHAGAAAAGLTLVPVQVHEDVTTDAEVAEWIGHAEVKSSRTDAEMAEVYLAVKAAHGLATDKEVAARLGHSAAKVCRCLAVLAQPADVVALRTDGRLSREHFAAARKCKDPARQAELLRAAAADTPGGKPKLTAAELAKKAAGRKAPRTHTLTVGELTVSWPRGWSLDPLLAGVEEFARAVKGRVRAFDPKAVELGLVLPAGGGS